VLHCHLINEILHADKTTTSNEILHVCIYTKCVYILCVYTTYRHTDIRTNNTEYGSDSVQTEGMKAKQAKVNSQSAVVNDIFDIHRDDIGGDHMLSDTLLARRPLVPLRTRERPLAKYQLNALAALVLVT